MIIHKALYPRDDLHRLYVSRRECKRGLANIGDSVNASMQRPEHYREKHGERLITATRNNTNDTQINRMTITRKKKRGKKKTMGYLSD